MKKLRITLAAVLAILVSFMLLPNQAQADSGETYTAYLTGSDSVEIYANGKIVQGGIDKGIYTSLVIKNQSGDSITFFGCGFSNGSEITSMAASAVATSRGYEKVSFDFDASTRKLTRTYHMPAPSPVPSSNEDLDVSPAHTHDFITGTIYEATCDQDGLEGTYCKTCGYVLNSSPISAMGYTLETYATQKITAAKSGQKIVLEFKELNSFPKAFMEKIAARVAEGVSFEFRYNVNHELQKITIPAYSTVDTSLDWYGYAKMAELYGMN